jgi:hypothetical protein
MPTLETRLDARKDGASGVRASRMAYLPYSGKSMRFTQRLHDYKVIVPAQKLNSGGLLHGRREIYVSLVDQDKALES